MNDKLDRYNEMRDFEHTDEPKGAPVGNEEGHSFVVQKHAARALHYDFRLELDGVLLSWAVPKGPSLSPKDRRLAVRTEDHPIGYRDFEGTIPSGQYGGGSVIVWDRGTWTPIGDPHAGLKKGHLAFMVGGEKLRGKYDLVRLPDRGGKSERSRSKENWLLIKGADAHVEEGAAADVVQNAPRSVLTGRTVEEVADGVTPEAEPPRRAPSKPTKRKATTRERSSTKAASKAKKSSVESGVPLPELGSITPQLATLVDRLPEDGSWGYEIKYDGYRALAWLEGGEARIATRGGKDWTHRFSGVVNALSRVRARTAIFDGEIVYVEEDGKTSFQKLQNALQNGESSARVAYFVFDLLHYDGVDLTNEPLERRKALLRTLLAGEKAPLMMGEHAVRTAGGNVGSALWREACKRGLEGIVAKRLDRPYLSMRTRDWVKVKCQKRQELVVVGSTPPQGARKGIGALLLAVHEDGVLRYAGKVGTGFSQETLRDLARRLEPLATDSPPFEGAARLRLRGARWAKPSLVCEVRFLEWTEQGRLRHPSFLGIREDKPAKDVVREVEAHATRGESDGPAAKKALATSARATNASVKNADAATSVARPRLAKGDFVVGNVVVTHPNRIMDVASGTTKADLVRYGANMAPWFLPFAKKRPLMLFRCGEAWDGDGSFGHRKGPKNSSPCFVQKHGGRGLTDGIGRDTIDGEEVIYATTPDEIVRLFQLNTVELHAGGSRLPTFERPDWIVFDLDPDVGLPFEEVVSAAMDLRDELAKMGLVTFVKTTGGKGLHVVLPLTPREEWPVVSAFAKAVAEGMVVREPKRFVATMTKAARTGKIFVDHFRNGRGATAVLPYSPRARKGATVALPVGWDELVKVSPQELTVLTVPDLLRIRKVDPWAELVTTKQLIPSDLVRTFRAT